jgi:tetratricopeptide (TPR) repeat protein
MLAKKPEERYQRAVDLLRELKGLQIPGLDEDWISDLPGFTSADLALGAAGRLAATQQLDRILQSQLKAQPRRRPLSALLAIIAALMLAGFGVGAVVAKRNHRDLLAAPSNPQANAVRRFETVKEQYSFAQLAIDDQEAAWKAVDQYFPSTESAENLRHSRLAMKGLARYYVDNRRYSEALDLYKQLAAVGPTDREFQLIGLIGQAVVLDKLGEDEQVREILAQIAPYLDILPTFNVGSSLRSQLEDLLKRYSSQGE